MNFGICFLAYDRFIATVQQILGPSSAKLNASMSGVAGRKL